MTSHPNPKSIVMDLGDLIVPEAILPAMKANTKKQVLQELSEKAAEQTGLSEREIFETVLQRERLGSTGVGNGIAIPHGKLGSLTKLIGVFGRLSRPIEFDALDDQPVDLVFLLLAPEGAGADHLKALSKIARLLRNPETVARLRASRDSATIYSLMTEARPPHAA
jgi:PTS system nitrogen regulatory IIA component